jgi:hypothetical protein
MSVDEMSVDEMTCSHKRKSVEHMLKNCWGKHMKEMGYCTILLKYILKVLVILKRSLF